MSFALRSSRVVFKNSVEPADLVIEHDYITRIDPYGTNTAAYDFGDFLVAPGFVDLHSDAIEKEIEPRPGASFPVDNALVELDKKLAMSGITTMFHAIAFNEESLVGQRGNETASRIIERIRECNREQLLVDNRVHARYEITSFSSIPLIKKYLCEGVIQILSFMDHSPGQGQFRTIEKWKDFHVPVYDLTEKQVSNVLDSQRNKRARSHDYLVDLARSARNNGVILASHDDDTTMKLDFMSSLGVSIAEFPLNLETAHYARHVQIATGMGAPNIVRGCSQSGNISARDLIREDAGNFLCSDYHPSSMLQSVYVIQRELGMSLAKAFDYVSACPARLVGLEDRGRIGEGSLADIIVIDDSLVPRIVLTLKSGNPVYSSLGCFCNYEYAA